LPYENSFIFIAPIEITYVQNQSISSVMNAKIKKKQKVNLRKKRNLGFTNNSTKSIFSWFCSWVKLYKTKQLYRFSSFIVCSY